MGHTDPTQNNNSRPCAMLTMAALVNSRRLTMAMLTMAILTYF